MDFSVFVILIIFCIILLYIYGNLPFNVWKKLKVDGPKTIPFFGNIHEIYSSQGGIATYSKWHSLFGRIYGIYYFRKPALVISDPIWIKEVFVKDFNQYRNRMAIDSNILTNQEIDSGIFHSRGDVWKRVRSIMSPSFSIGKTKAMTAIVDRSARCLGENIAKLTEEGLPFEAKKLLGAYAVDVVTGTGFSIDVDSLNNADDPFTKHGRSLFEFHWTLKILGLLSASFPAIMSPVAKYFRIGFIKTKDIEFFDKNLRFMISERKKETEKKLDVLQNLINAECESSTDDGKLKLTHSEIIAQGITLFLAGYETTSSTLQFLFYELANHQDAMEKIMVEIDDVIGDQIPTYELCQNLKYTEAAINETLRMYPPLSVLGRECCKPTKLFHLDLPANCIVAVPVYNLQRDPEFWKNPNEFNPDRFMEGSSSYEKYNPFTYMPFGLGPRQCLGMMLGMLEMKLGLIRILQKVVVTKATPEKLEISDFTTILQPSVPITIYCKPRTQKNKK